MPLVRLLGRWLLADVVGVLAFCGSARGEVMVVPGTPSVLDLHIEGHLILNSTTEALWNESKFRLVGTDWPGQTNPPVAGDWTLDHMARADDGADYVEGRSFADFSYLYAGLRTDLLLRSRSEGEVNSSSPGDDSFQTRSQIIGHLEMYLTSDSVADAAGPYDVSLVLTLSGSDLSVLGDAAAIINHFVRVTPTGDAAIDFIGAYTDVGPPPLNPDAPPTYLLQAFYSFAGVPLAPGGQTPLANVELGVGLADGLMTSADGQTQLPNVFLSEASSLFDSSLSLSFQARLVPEPSSFVLAVLGALGTSIACLHGRCARQRRRREKVQ